MKNKTIWLVLGGIGLVLIGIVLGLLLSGGILALRVPRGDVFVQPFAYGPMMRGWNNHMMGLWGWPRPFLGLRWLVMALFWLGPIAGIVALIIVLAGRKPSAPQQSDSVPPSPPEA
jgi:hypothetical protein